ncbi:unnamed protein product, partial [Effrenium voratum]
GSSLPQIRTPPYLLSPICHVLLRQQGWSRGAPAFARPPGGPDGCPARASPRETRLGHRTDWPTPRRQLRGSQRRRRLGGFGDFGGAAAAGAGSGAEAASGARHLQGPRQRAVRAEREGGALGPHHRAVLQAGRGSAHGPETGDAGAAQEASGDLQAAPRKVNRSAQRSPAPCELSDVPC